MAVRRKTCVGNVQFNLGLLREGTVLKSNGFIMTDKGRMIDSSLLDEDDPVRKKLEERQKRMEEEQQFKDSQPALKVSEAFKKTGDYHRTYINIPFRK